MTFRSVCYASCAVAALLISPAVAAQVPPGYVETGRFTNPFGSFDVRFDGRLIGLSGSDILLQDSVNTGSFSTIATIDPTFTAAFGASFVAVSPDGTRLAVGDNTFGGPADAFVGVFDIVTGSLLTSAVAPNFDGDWADNNTLFVAGGSSVDSNVVTRIDAATGLSTTVINDTAGFSGAVAVAGGTLFAGNGFATGGPGDSQTGEVRSFDLAALTGSPILSFENDGLFAGGALSAGSLDVDASGNLIIGGGDLFGGSGDLGSVAVVDASGNRVDIASPFGSDLNFGQYNAFTDEILVFGGAGEIVRFAAIPAPASGALVVLGLVGVGRRRG
ncbi:MAG: hypothetical protein AAF108_00705 [Planctomycetota bacterium]